MRIFLRLLCVLLLCAGGAVYSQEPAAESAATQTPTQEAQEKPEAEAADQAPTPVEGAESPEATAAQAPVTETPAEQPPSQPAEQQAETEQSATPEGAAQEEQPEVAPEGQPTEQTSTEEQAATEQPAEQQADQSAPEASAQEEQPDEQAEQESPTQEAEQAQEEEPVKIEEIEGIDTVDLKEPRGNWLFKRIWWERAENKYDKIRTLVQQVLEARMKFFMERSDIDKNVLDPFYIEAGLGRGEFQEILQELTAKLERLREKDATLSGEERSLLTTLQKENQMLEQLALDIKSIGQLDIDLDNALAKLMEQINRVRGYERDAWRYFKEISRVLSDKKARELFYKMEVISNNIKDIKEYIDQAFAQHYEQVISTIKENIERIKTSVQSFKEKGVDFKEQAQKMFDQEIETERQKAVDEAEEDEEEEEPQGWFGSTIGMIGGAVQTTFDMVKFVVGTVWDYTVYIIKMPYNMIFGPKEVVEDDEDIEAEEQVAVEGEQEKPSKQEKQPEVQEEVVEEQTDSVEPQMEQPVVGSGMLTQPLQVPGQGDLVQEPKPQIKIPTMPQAPEGQSVESEQEMQEAQESQDAEEQNEQPAQTEVEETETEEAVQTPAES